ncbi:hypothetical protein F4694_003864 [Bacillus niacini]|uniref:Uncharacterized protein n=1 Tax=Neobacillus niacini TaxID=86668 RepID=A0A852TG41_9BACI|nr:hypothetical protein [Neobacillus niacini]
MDQKIIKQFFRVCHLSRFYSRSTGDNDKKYD